MAPHGRLSSIVGVVLAVSAMAGCVGNPNVSFPVVINQPEDLKLLGAVSGSGSKLDPFVVSHVSGRADTVQAVITILDDVHHYQFYELNIENRRGSAVVSSAASLVIVGGILRGGHEATGVHATGSLTLRNLNISGFATAVDFSGTDAAFSSVEIWQFAFEGLRIRTGLVTVTNSSLRTGVPSAIPLTGFDGTLSNSSVAAASFGVPCVVAERASRGVIARNVFASCGGVYLGANSRNTAIFLNSFLVPNASRDEGIANRWNSTEVGNFWAGFSGSTVDGKVWVEPHAIPPNGIDHHPLVARPD